MPLPHLRHEKNPARAAEGAPAQITVLLLLGRLFRMAEHSEPERGLERRISHDPQEASCSASSART